MRFRYEAMDTAGAEVRDTIEADNQDAAQQAIKKKGFFVTSIKNADPPKPQPKPTRGVHLFCSVSAEGDTPDTVNYCLIPTEGLLDVCNEAVVFHGKAPHGLRELTYEWVIYFYTTEDLPERFKALADEADEKGCVLIEQPTDEEIDVSSPTEIDRLHVQGGSKQVYWSGYEGHLLHHVRPVTIDYLKENVPQPELVSLERIGIRVIGLLSRLTGEEVAELYNAIMGPHARDNIKFRPGKVDMWEVIPHK